MFQGNICGVVVFLVEQVVSLCYEVWKFTVGRFPGLIAGHIEERPQKSTTKMGFLGTLCLMSQCLVSK